jgi:hypothetical protein
MTGALLGVEDQRLVILHDPAGRDEHRVIRSRACSSGVTEGRSPGAPAAGASDGLLKRSVIAMKTCGAIICAQMRPPPPSGRLGADAARPVTVRALPPRP